MVYSVVFVVGCKTIGLCTFYTFRNKSSTAAAAAAAIRKARETYITNCMWKCSFLVFQGDLFGGKRSFSFLLFARIGCNKMLGYFGVGRRFFAANDADCGTAQC